MRRSTFEGRVRELFKDMHETREVPTWTYMGYYIGEGSSPFDTKAKHDDTGAAALELAKNLRAILPGIEARLARLECPGHDYKADACVKCGAPRKGKK